MFAIQPVFDASEMNKDDFEIPVSWSNDYCEGYWNPVVQEKGNYLVSFVLGTGTACFHTEQANDMYNLEGIDAFDRAETAEAYIGQINMITVSSFCGPRGRIWGYDLVPSKQLRRPLQWGPREVKSKQGMVPVYSLEPFLEASKSLFGTVDNQRFPLLPGSHVPCANKSITKSGLGYVYCGLAVGIPKDRAKAACLIMEDVGWVNQVDDVTKDKIFQRLADSVVRVGMNQRVEYQEIFCGTRYGNVGANEVGCALAAAPYFSLASRAIPGGNTSRMKTFSLDEWQIEVGSFNQR